MGTHGALCFNSGWDYCADLTMQFLESLSCSCCASSCTQSCVGIDRGLIHDKNLEPLEVGLGKGFLVILILYASDSE